MTPESLLALCTARGIALDKSVIGRGTERPAMTAAEAAVACAGLPRAQFLAALYTYAGDESVRSVLKVHLLEWALEERERHQWAHRVDRFNGHKRHFLEALIEVFLLDEWRPGVFRAAPHLRAVLLDVDWPTWARTLAPIYLRVAGEYATWLAHADGHIYRRTRNGS